MKPRVGACSSKSGSVSRGESHQRLVDLFVEKLVDFFRKFIHRVEDGSIRCQLPVKPLL